ncbi:hypothetical protein FRC04_001408 [Tulasnella sp. 424]|nr:hypothetical protein FRC04_001408 [Tulasnella sp. 424]
MNPDAEDRSIEMDEQDLHDTPSDNPASPPPDLHAPSAASVSSAVGGGSADKKAVVRGARLSEATKARRASKEAAKAGAAAAGPPTSSTAGPSSRSLHPLPKVEEQHEFMDLDTSGHAPLSAVSTAPPNTGRPRSFSTKENPGPAPYHNHNPNGSGPSSAGPHALSPTGPPAIPPHAFPGPYAPQYMPDAGSSGAPAISSPTSPTRPDNMTRKGSTASGDDEDSRSDENLFPGSMVQKERNKFLSMVLNPPNSAPNHRGHNSGRPSTEEQKASERWTQNPVWEPPSIPALPKCFDPPKEALPDPLDLKLITEPEAELLLARVLQHLNPFVNLFDESLHTVQYVRARSSFLFTVLMMAGCKFFKPELFKSLQKMSYVFASRALEEQWKGLEIVQAFCCMVYWKEPEDNAETSDVFYLRRNGSRDSSDVNYEVLLMGCNRKLTDWIEFWELEMQTAGGGEFHDFILRFFRLHVRLFLNSLGLTASSNQAGSTFSLQSLTLCYTSAKETLEIVTHFSRLGVLKFGQDVITVMSAYAAIFLLKLLRRTGRHSSAGLNPEDVHSLIKQTARAFYVAGDSGSPSTSAKAHARFMNSLVDNKTLQVHASESQLGSEHVPREGLPRQPMALPSQPEAVHMYSTRQQQQQQQQQQQTVASPASTMGSQTQLGPYGPGSAGTPPTHPENLNMTTNAMIAQQQQQQQMMAGMPGQMMDGNNAGGGQMYYAPPAGRPPQQQQPPQQARRPTISQAPSSYGAPDPNTPPNAQHPPPPHHPGHMRMNSTSGVVNGYGPHPNPANGAPAAAVNIPPPQPHYHQQPQPQPQQQQQQQQPQTQQQMYAAAHHPQGIPMAYGGDQPAQTQQYQAEQAILMPLGQGDAQLDPMYTRHILDQLGMPDVFPAGYAGVGDQFGVVGDQTMYR